MARPPSETDAVTNERDFYRRLLDLGHQIKIEPLLEQALALIVDVTGATTAYLELYDDVEDTPRYWRGHRCSESLRTSIRASISHGVIAQTISEGKTVQSASAQSDARFADLKSVQDHEIGAVLCAPIGSPPIGVIYLQDRASPGGFAQADCDHAELFARQLAPLADRLLAREPRGTRTDLTREVRARFRCEDIVGRSAALAKVLKAASQVAPLDIDVLITGPVGTGKSALARAIAVNGPRARGPFVALNCAALPEPLLESELYGAERGAHATANRKLPGKVAAAEGGTLFLDEIAELTPGAQAKLLHLLQTREYYPLGATQPKHADIRIITATNCDLRARVAERAFREDLYYRVHVLPIEMPGLAERREDIPELVSLFASRACQHHGIPPLAVPQLTRAACREADWPGHIRQLEHAIEAGVIRAHGDRARELKVHHVFPAVAPSASSPDQPRSYHDATRRFQRDYLQAALENNQWNVAKTASELELTRGYVYELIHSFEIARSSQRA